MFGWHDKKHYDMNCLRYTSSNNLSFPWQWLKEAEEEDEDDEEE